MTTSVFILLLLAVVIIGYFISAYNTELRLRNLVLAQQDICEANFDKMWKVIKQITHVSDAYLETFKEIYPKLIAGRYQGKDMAFIVEQNPPLDSSILRQLATAIEANRQEFFAQQRLLVARQKEHSTYIHSIPACMVLLSAQEIKITIITSDYTEKIYASGKENI